MTEQISTLAYRNFVDTCRSTATRIIYIRALHYFMSYLRLAPEAYDKLLEQDLKTAQMNICDYISYLRKQKTAAHKSVGVYVAAIRKFYSMNDVQLNWDKIHSFEGDDERQTEDRPYTHSEILTLIQRTSQRNRAIILLMASGGLRVGAVPLLRNKDLEPIDKYSIYKVNVYARSRKSKYFTFCSPECRKEIDAYLEWRKRWGERIEPDSPLFRKEYNATTDLESPNIKPLGSNAIRFFIQRLLTDTGLRTHEPLMEGKTPKRHLVMMNHGFRKFFETNSFKAGMNNIYLRRLMGQKAGLEDAYLKTSEEELLEGDSRHIGYTGVIDQLTINEENRLRRKVKELTIKADKVDNLSADFAALKKKLGL